MERNELLLAVAAGAAGTRSRRGCPSRPGVGPGLRHGPARAFLAAPGARGLWSFGDVGSDIARAAEPQAG